MTSLEDKRRDFLDMLRMEYKAKVYRGESNPERISVRTEVLENLGLHDGFGMSAFCQSLIIDGYIADYEALGDGRLGESFEDYMDRTPTKHKALGEERTLLTRKLFLLNKQSAERAAIENRVGEIDAEISAIWKQYGPGFGHMFIVNEDMLFSSKNTSKHRMAFDGKRTIKFKEHTYSFHAGGLPLRFFRQLWARRRETRGKEAKQRGEAMTAAAYAVQLGLVTSAREYDNDAKQSMKSLIAGIRRTLKAGGFPARLDTGKNICLIVNNP